MKDLQRFDSRYGEPTLPILLLRLSLFVTFLLKGHMLVVEVSLWVYRVLCRRCQVLINQEDTLH